jgi:hypothetical protein
MKRIVSVIAVVALMVAMITVSAMPAFAAKPGGVLLTCAHPGDPFAAQFVGPNAADVFAQATATGYSHNECSLSAHTNPM